MTRPKVAPEARRRTEQACESCKRRKQKCNGLTPCVTCAKRKFNCVYSDRERADTNSYTSVSHPAKRRVTDSNPADFPSPKQETAKAAADLNTPSDRPRRPSSFLSLLQPPQAAFNFADRPQLSELGTDLGGERGQAAQSLQQFSALQPNGHAAKTTLPVSSSNADQSNVSSNTAQPSVDEEAVVYSETRMLQDPTGRLLYVGDSATLSFLQLIRMMVESVCGQSAFTTDPRRHKIMETQFSLPSSTQITHLIPDRMTALVLVDSFFTNTHAIVQIYERNAFLRRLEATYSDPLSAEPNWLCHLNLVFAIGLTMAVHKPSTRDAAIIDKLRREHTDRAEVFYLNAKSLNDPMVGLEDADFWSVQALLLMTVYMLAKSKRNTAFALLGMAIRSSYALGLHREETLIIFSVEDQVARRDVWRSLFVMDRFLSCSLGRPAGISEDDCSGDMLRPLEPTILPDEFDGNVSYQGAVSMSETSSSGLEAAVRSCSVIGTILKRVYQQRKISTRLAQEIADICKVWPKALSPPLHWRQASSACPSQGIAILHVNLLYCHSITLLTRPFFLFILNDVLQQTQAQPFDGSPRRNYSKMEKFSEACVIASTHTVVLVQSASEAGHLPQRNPFVIYFLFAAALIILSNEFAQLYRNDAGDQCIQNSITIMAYCAETDPQANRLLYILSTFRDVVIERRSERATQTQTQTQQQQQQQQQSNQLPPFNLKPNINSYGVPTNTASVSPLAPTVSRTANSKAIPQLVPPSSFYSESNTIPPIEATHSTTLPPPSQITPTNVSRPSITQPIEPALNSPVPPNPLSRAGSAPQTPHLPSLDRDISFSNIFDFSAMGADRMSISEDSSGPEEHIDFDALWAWPSNTPAHGTPRASTVNPSVETSSVVQGVSDSTVPLFGVVERQGIGVTKVLQKRI